ncbi:hypothetical protein AYM17_07260 [Coxiella burnetii]|nr:hypothetical protein AYM17_07260 [Coxiella burnetii]
MGAFVNNVPLKIDVEKNTSLLGIIEDLTNQRKNSKKHQWYPTLNIIENLRKTRKEFSKTSLMLALEKKI